MTKNLLTFIILFLVLISVLSFYYFYSNGLVTSYNDARSHLNIARRVVEGLKPGVAQLGSVWLPLPHVLMIPTVWNDFLWHSGLSGAIPSMIAFVFTGVIIYLFLQKLKVGLLGRCVGVFVFATNLNILYLQSTSMTELLLLATMTIGVYELFLWHQNSKILHLIKSAFWIMLSTLVRYDGWFLLAISTLLIIFHILRKRGYKKVEGSFILFSTLAAFGVFLWILWNLLIFKDPLYFIFGPYSAHAQQQLLEKAGNLQTKGNLLLSVKFYLYAQAYNLGAFTTLLGFMGTIVLLLDKSIKMSIKIVFCALYVPLLFNILALYLGHSVLFIKDLSGSTWFNVRYGVMMAPTMAIFIGYMTHKLKELRYSIIGLLLFVTFFAFINGDAVTIDDAQVGASQKNVTEVSSWLARNASDKEGFILISAASHDAIIFSSGLPMKRFIHEGTGQYWESAIEHPSRWARWIIMRTYDTTDLTYKSIKDSPVFDHYRLVGKYPFADIYELKEEYLKDLNTKPVLLVDKPNVFSSLF